MLFLAIDQGTSSTKAHLYDGPGPALASAGVPVTRTSDRAGAVHQDPVELVESCRAAARAALRQARVRASDLTAVALANQGESYLLLDGRGRPVTPVIGWQDVTGNPAAERVAAGPHAKEIQARTGLPVHPMFPGTKLADHCREVRVNGVRFATLDTWLIHELDPGRPFVTDRATASRTMLVALDGADWDEELLSWLNVPRELLATIVPCDQPQAEIELDGAMIPLWASGYDMGLALLGHGCLDRGETKATFGTCLGAMAAAGDRPLTAEGLSSVIAYDLNGVNAYALDGEIAACGALISWAIGCGIAASSRELEQLAGSVSDAGGVVLVPAIQGLGAPHWRADVRASLHGLGQATGRPQLARAVLDAIAWSLADVLGAMRAHGIALSTLRADGGLARSELLMQRCADVCQVTVVRGHAHDATGYGAAALIMLGHRLATADEIRMAAVGDRRTEPQTMVAPDERERWAAALGAAIAERVEPVE